MMILRSIYADVDRIGDAARFLYDLLEDRPPEVNISHRKMPTWEQHCSFILSRPYKEWCTIFVSPHIISDFYRTVQPIGAIYLSKNDEIGVFIKRDMQGKGFGRAAIDHMMLFNSGTLFANINPKNKESIRLFESLGFKHIQNTYRLDREWH